MFVHAISQKGVDRHTCIVMYTQYPNTIYYIMIPCVSWKSFLQLCTAGEILCPSDLCTEQLISHPSFAAYILEIYISAYRYTNVNSIVWYSRQCFSKGTVKGTIFMKPAVLEYAIHFFLQTSLDLHQRVIHRGLPQRRVLHHHTGPPTGRWRGGSYICLLRLPQSSQRTPYR